MTISAHRAIEALKSQTSFTHSGRTCLGSVSQISIVISQRGTPGKDLRLGTCGGAVLLEAMEDVRKLVRRPPQRHNHQWVSLMPEDEAVGWRAHQKLLLAEHGLQCASDN